jgi:K(+)-stimulated pyrophosphate-energized sodium pump
LSLTDFTAWTAWPLGVVGLLLAFGALVYVRRQPPGNEAMRDWAGQIQRGANAFLRRQTIALAAFVVVGALLLAPVASIPTAGAFALGAATALAAGWVAVFAATRANVRVAEAARVAGEIPALRVALGGAAAAGFTIAALGLLGIGALYFGLIYLPGAYLPEQFARFGEILAGFALGASSIALFARVGAGIFTKAAEAGADLVGRADLPRDDPRNPATVADNVGDCVGDTAGMGVDLLESFVGAVVATIALGAYSSAYANNRPEAVALPILVAGAGLLATVVGIAAIRAAKTARPAMVLRAATLGAGVLFLLLAFVAVGALGLDLEDPVAGTSYHRYGPFWAILAGALAALVISVVTEYYTGARPTRRIMRAASGGPANTRHHGDRGGDGIDRDPAGADRGLHLGGELRGGAVRDRDRRRGDAGDGRRDDHRERLRRHRRHGGRDRADEPPVQRHAPHHPRAQGGGELGRRGGGRGSRSARRG